MNTCAQLLRRWDIANTEGHIRTREMVINNQARCQYVALKDDDEITAYVEMNDVSDFQESRARTRVQQQILEKLSFPSLTHGYESIVEAYPETFDWVLRDPTEGQRAWSNFSDWLESGNGVYWINGKAGSGKSTLMKHIFDDAKTLHHLESWSQKSTDQGCHSAPLCVTTFFSWNSGTPDQKSQRGLLCSLLLQILDFCPDLVPVVFPPLLGIVLFAPCHQYGDVTMAFKFPKAQKRI
jgi:hypothetical protein